MVIYQFAGPVQNQVDDFLADGVVTAGVVVGCILLASDELLRMEQLAVRASAHLVCRTSQVEVIIVFRRLKEDNLKGGFIGELAGRSTYGGSIRGLRRKRRQT